jgi:hypothetical protein
MIFGFILPLFLNGGSIPWAFGAFSMARWFDRPGSFQKTFMGMSIVQGDTREEVLANVSAAIPLYLDDLDGDEHTRPA